MSKKEKLLAKFMSAPKKKDITYDELKTLLKAMGYEKEEGSGSRVTFFHPKTSHFIDLHRPHPGNELKLYQVNIIQEKLKELLEILNEK
ncbi:type II toxin-antitoxin system HicA family toxin [Desulfobacterales bacterium HSG2]|nr:type II toxin-antitoxin system HicA family toxin [Desulfobacterales bacterium HSG2]